MGIKGNNKRVHRNHLTQQSHIGSVNLKVTEKSGIKGNMLSKFANSFKLISS